jgi:hypothetical protein
MEKKAGILIRWFGETGLYEEKQSAKSDFMMY